MTMIKKNESISRCFEIRDVKTEEGIYECVVYKELPLSFLKDVGVLFLMDRKKFKKNEILVYSKYGMNSKDKRFEQFITVLKEYLDEEAITYILLRVFENLNYDDDLEYTETILFDELTNSQKKKNRYGIC